MIKILLSATVLAASFAAGAASANCAAKDLAGTWKLYTAAAADGITWGNCTVVIGVAGGFQPGSACLTSGGQGTAVTGQLRLSSAANCAFTGKMVFAADKTVATLSEATLQIEKHAAIGVGIFPSTDLGFIFNMARIK
jgi:hypothetical protein